MKYFTCYKTNRSERSCLLLREGVSLKPSPTMAGPVKKVGGVVALPELQ